MQSVIFPAVVARAGYSVALRNLKKQLKGVAPSTYTLLYSGTALVFSLLTLPFIGLSLHGLAECWPFVVLVSVTFGPGLQLVTLAATKFELDVSVNQLCQATPLLWAAVLAPFFYGDGLPIIHWLCIGILGTAIGGIFVGRGGATRNVRGVLCSLAAAFCFAIFQLSSGKLPDDVSLGTYLMIVYLGSTLTLVCGFGRQFARDWPLLCQHKSMTIWVMLKLGVTGFAYVSLAFLATRHTQDKAITVAFLTLHVVLSVLAGVMFFKEHEAKMRKVLAAVLSVFAAYLIIRY